jgi:CelD/BcsL family acetyltransferase involved in cellulose biosynthesis
MTSHLSSPPALEQAAIDDSRWVAFVESHPQATPFHHPAWGRLIARCYGFESFVLVKTAADGSAVAGLPVVEAPRRFRSPRWVSIAFADHCPPLGFTEPADFAHRLELARDRAGVTSVEIRASLDGSAFYHQSNGVRHVLPLGNDPEAQFQAFHRMTRRNVRHAERSGVVIREGEDVTALTETFYNLHLETRKRLGVPVQPRRFFRLLWEELVAPGLGFVLIGCARGKPVAAAVFLSWNRSVIYKFGASHHDAWHARPNNLIFWHAIRRAIANGDRYLDFGRSELDQEGLRSFKAGWGAREESLVYSYLSEQPPAASILRGAALLAPVIRHSPRWVPRLLGELFYRHAA